MLLWASISASASIRRGTFPSSCARACVVMLFVAQAQAEAQEQTQAEAQGKLKYFLSADKQANVSSPTLTVTKDGDGN